MSSTRSVEKEGISFIIHRDYPNPTNGANVGNCSKNERSMSVYTWLQKGIEMARNRVWRAPEGQELGSLGYLSTYLAYMERRQPGGLRDLRQGRRLYIGSDYGQSFTGRKYKTYSFVITADSLAPEWKRRRSMVRDELLRGSGEMGYKNLKDGIKFRALIPFLEAANALPGLSVTVAIAKDVRYLSPGRIADAYGPDADNPWKGDENAFERAQRIVHVAGLLLGGLAGPGQHVDWVTDKDDIACSPQRIEHLKRMVNSTCALYLPPSMGQLDIRTNDPDPDMFLSDFLAIPDLIAGCLSEVLNHCYEQV